MSILHLVTLNPTDLKNCYILQNLPVKKLGEIVEVSTNQYGLSLFSSLISLLALGVYTLLTFDAGNDDDDSDNGGGGLMQPVN